MTEQKIIKTFDVERIRKDFPLLQTEMRGKPLVFLDSAASSQKPKVVIIILNMLMCIEEYMN